MKRRRGMTRRGRRTERQLNFTTVTSLLALFIALGGTVYAAATIGAGDIKRNAVRAKHIKSANVKRADIAPNAVNGGRVANESLAAADLGPNSVTGSEIANGSVSASKLGVAPQWSNIAFTNGWAAFDGNLFDYTPLQCYKDPFGFVHFRGAAERTSLAGGFIVGVLPEACRVFPAGTPGTTYAGFAGSALDETGTGVGGASMFVGVQGNDNTVGFDFSPQIDVGDGLAADGVAIGVR